MIEIIDLGLMEYDEVLKRQKEYVSARIANDIPDQLILVEHPCVVTLGKSSGSGDLILSEKEIHDRGGTVQRVERGGMATYHGPGQLVAYPIMLLRNQDIPSYVDSLQNIIAETLRAYGLTPMFKMKNRGVWVNSRKIASIGIAVRDWVTFHGISLNVSTDLSPLSWIISCGHAEEKFTTIEMETGKTIDMKELKNLFVKKYYNEFGYSGDINPSHLRSKVRPFSVRVADNTGAIEAMTAILHEHKLATVCHSAHCPNLSECFSRGTATFMILGTRCTRNCSFCAVETGMPVKVDPTEPDRVAQAAKDLGLKYVVVTSVTRDDLPDGGAEHYARTIRALRKHCGDVCVEVLIPDFGGDMEALEVVCQAAPDVLNHNIETVPRLYPGVRSQADFERSLKILQKSADRGLCVKSGIMLGMGEYPQETENVLSRIKQTGCRYLTIGQYLAPSRSHHPVIRYVSSDEFRAWEEKAYGMGFKHVAAGPLIRSSYKADQMQC